jgi:hypothetical protein
MDCMPHRTSATGDDLRAGSVFAQRARILQAFPDIPFALHRCYALGDKVAVEWGATRYQSGTGLGMVASGTELNMTAMGKARHETRMVTNFDRLQSEKERLALGDDECVFVMSGEGMIGRAHGPFVGVEGYLAGAGGDNGLDRKDQAFGEQRAIEGVGVVGYGRVFVNGAPNAVAA